MQYIGIISLGVTILIQLIGVIVFFTKMNQRLKNLETQVAKLIEVQEETKSQNQESIDAIWASMTSKFEKIFSEYLTLETATEFFKKKGN